MLPLIRSSQKYPLERYKAFFEGVWWSVYICKSTNKMIQMLLVVLIEYVNIYVFTLKPFEIYKDKNNIFQHWNLFIANMNIILLFVKPIMHAAWRTIWRAHASKMSVWGVRRILYEANCTPPYSEPFSNHATSNLYIGIYI